MKSTINLNDGFPMVHWMFSNLDTVDLHPLRFLALRGKEDISFTEQEKFYVCSMDIPGIKKENLKVILENDLLKIYAHRGPDPITKRIEMKIEKAIPLPSDVHLEQLEVNLDLGVLTCILPKVEKALPKEIAIKEGSSAYFSGKNH